MSAVLHSSRQSSFRAMNTAENLLLRAIDLRDEIFGLGDADLIALSDMMVTQLALIARADRLPAVDEVSSAAAA